MSGVFRGNEFQVQGVRLVLQVLEPARGGGRCEREGFGFVIGLPAHDQRQDDPRQVNSLAPARPASPDSFRNFPKRSSVRPAVMALVRSAADIWLP